MATTMPNLDEQLLIGGTWTDATGGARFDVTDPGSGATVGSAVAGTVVATGTAVAAAAVTGAAAGSAAAWGAA